MESAMFSDQIIFDKFFNIRSINLQRMKTIELIAENLSINNLVFDANHFG